jgi:hypothetical protein
MRRMGQLKKYGELGRKEKNGTTEKVWRARKKGEEWDNSFFLALHTFSVVPFFSFLPSSPYFFSCPILFLST